MTTSTSTKPAAKAASTKAPAKTAPRPTPRPRVTGVYDPAADSTPALAKRATETGRLVLDWSGMACLCGCGRPCKGRFAPGHDARLKGKLQRAHIAGVGVLIVSDGKEKQATARAVAARLSSTKHDWAGALDAAVEAAKARAAEQAVKKAAAEAKAAERRAAAKAKGTAKIGLDDIETSDAA